MTLIKGSYIENYKKPNAKEVVEEVFFVVDLDDKGNLEKDLRKLGEEFEQDSILFIPKGGEKSTLIGTNKCEDGYPGYGKKVHFNKRQIGGDGEFFSRVNGRPFVFKEAVGNGNATRPEGGMGRWGCSAVANAHWSDIDVDAIVEEEETVVETNIEYNAYWISPKGKVIPVPSRHIHSIIEEPKKFGLTTKKIKDLYDKYDEPMGHEGQAREDIMLDLMKKGWIRLRFIPRNYKWTVQTFKMNKKTQDNIWDGFAQLVKKGWVGEGHDVVILVDDRMDSNGEVGDIIDYSIFESFGNKGGPVCQNAEVIFLEDFNPND